MSEITIRIAGEAGQGVQTVGMALCKIFKKLGWNVFANQDYMSRVRGGNNFFQIRVSDKPVYALRQKADIVIILDKKSAELHRKDLNDNGILIDSPLHDLASTAGGDMFISTVSYAVAAGMLGVEFNYIEEIIKGAFSDKGDDIAAKNVNAAKLGFDYAKNNFKQKVFQVKPKPAKSSFLLNGNDAIALGAIKAGCKFYSAYPMTPSTSIMNVVAEYAKKFNIVVEQAEDEIAAINMAIGASFAGARSMTSTSGGGFALMVEGVSLAAMTETPVVIVDAQRPAPATGFPTRTEQSDLEFLLHAGHGEFARVIYAPGTIEEAYYLTVKAFNIAEKYQIPVLIMTDQYLADCYMNILSFDTDKIKVKRYIISKEESAKITDYKRYRLTKSGISPRAIPSWIEGVVYADSDEHTEEGHITESADMRVNMVQKRLYKKMNGLSEEIEPPSSYKIEGADTVLIGFGSTYGVIKETVDTMPDKKIGFAHIPQVWPFPSDKLTALLKNAKNILTVENNAAGQLARLIRRETGIKANNSILRFDGRPFNFDYLSQRLKGLKI